MQKALRVVVALPALLFGVNGLGFIVNPTQAAGSLGVTLPEGIARSTLIGDLGAFFLFLSGMIVLGVLRLDRRWLVASATLLVTAACMRLLAWAVHGADFATQFIVAELLMAALLYFGGNKLTAVAE